MDQTVADPELSGDGPVENRGAANQDSAPAVPVAWDLQGGFGEFAVLVRHKNSLTKLESQFAFRAQAATHDPGATLCRISYAIDAQHGLPRRILWTWSHTHGLQAILKPPIQTLDDTNPLKLIPISKARYNALAADKQSSLESN